MIDRVDRLEEALANFITSVGIEFNKVYNSQLRTEAELRAFKEEMRLYRERAEADTRAFQEEMREFKDEMRAFKDEMRAYKEENRRQTREMNRQWGDLANKLGTLVEDLVYPSLPRIIRDTLGREILDLGVCRKRRLADGRVKEFDAVAVTADLVGLNSTKATLISADVDRFVADIAAFREFLPEYGALPVVGILATLAVEESVLNYAEKAGFLVLAVGDEVMEVKNRPGFEPKRW
ncbi:MAG: hypothetical protein F9K25_08885 [Candidatus Contendobacter sp.]|nr:MAG: hypothetical protein F9K25_08885 [Candidatus Contendobacter sp.]